MTVSTLKPQSATTLNDLRDALESAERQLVRLDRSNILQFLVQLDKIEEMWTEFSDSSTIRAEEGRWQSLLKRITTSPQLLTTAAAQAGGLTKLRSQHAPATGLWWHVDEQVAAQRGKTFQRLGIIAVALVAVVALFWVINNVMSRTIEIENPTLQIDQLVESQSWQKALTVVETARKTSPDDVNLIIWDSVLAGQLGNRTRAQTSLDEAQAKFTDTPTAFWTLVGNFRLQAADLAGAEEAGQEALTLSPQDANVTFLLGRVAEGRGDMAQANEYFSQTVTLAGDSNPELVALVKIRMSNLLQSIPLPSPAPIPTATK